MKTLRINGVRPPMNSASAYTEHHFYAVLLGNGVKVMFTSERAALAFQAETDRWITAHLMDCNFLLVDAFTAYRGAWVILDRASRPHADQQAREFIESAWRGMDMAIIKAGGENGWSFAWKFLHGAIASVRSLALLLRDLHLRTNAVERARMELLSKRATVILEEMAHYGSDAKGAIKVITL